MRPKLIGGRRVDACLQRCVLRLRGEDGIALVMALGIMLVLTIVLTSTMLLTASGARDAHRTNAGQQAYALAEAGVNNAMAILTAYYGNNNTRAYPTDSGGNCILNVQEMSYRGYVPDQSEVDGCGDPAPFQSTYNGGSCSGSGNGCVTWSGALQHVTPNYQWVIHSTGTVANPTGPTTSPVTRTVTVLVPVIPGAATVKGQNALNWVFGSSINFLQSTDIESPIFSTGNLEIGNTAVVCGSAGEVQVGGNLTLDNPQNQIGQGSTKNCGSGDPKLPQIHVQGSPPANSKTCTWQKTSDTTCTTKENVFANTSDNSYDSGLGATLQNSFPDGTVGKAIAQPGPNAPCNQARPGFLYPTFNFTTSTPIDLTPNVSYSCQVSFGGVVIGELTWNNTSKQLAIQGTIYLPGDVTISQSAQYLGAALLFVGGGFYIKTTGGSQFVCPVMTPANENPAQGGTCDTNVADWDPNQNVLIVYALGTSAAYPGFSVAMKNKITFEGALMGNSNITTDTTANIIGPMDSKNGTVSAGQTGALDFPAIHFLPSNWTGTFTPARLLKPWKYAGG